MKTNRSTVSFDALCIVLIFPIVLFCVSCQAPREKTADTGLITVAQHTGSISRGSGMVDPWGNPYKIVIPGEEPLIQGVTISPDEVMVDPWGNPYKIVPR